MIRVVPAHRRSSFLTLKSLVFAYSLVEYYAIMRCIYYNSLSSYWTVQAAESKQGAETNRGLSP